MPNGMRVETRPFTRFHFGQVDTAVLVADHHVDVAPRSLGMNGLLSFARVRHDSKSWRVRRIWQGDDG